MRGPLRRILSDRLEERPVISALKERRRGRDPDEVAEVVEEHIPLKEDWEREIQARASTPLREEEPKPREFSLYNDKAKVDTVNFPSDREYTLNSMQEQFGLMELHLRDGSYKLCNCNPEKHLPLLAGLAAEGVGFTDDPDEKLFMDRVRDTARTWRERIKSGRFTGADADTLRSWAREQRHRIEYQAWHGKMPENPELNPELCPTCVMSPQDQRRRMK